MSNEYEYSRNARSGTNLQMRSELNTGYTYIDRSDDAGQGKNHKYDRGENVDATVVGVGCRGLTVEQS